MRELILKMSISIDGFVSDLDGRNAWMFGGDQTAKDWSVETIWNAGLHIMGSRTFLAMAAYWPTSTDMFAPPMNQIPKAVFSRREQSLLKNATARAIGNATSPVAGSRQPAEAQPGAESWSEAYVASGDLSDEIAKLKAQAGKPIIAHGGASFARSLVARRLIDRYVLLVHPTALGAGHSVFSELAAPLRLKLTSSQAFPGGAVAQTYQNA